MIRSLYAKIVLWFVGTALVAGLGLVGVSLVYYGPRAGGLPVWERAGVKGARIPAWRRMLAAQLALARAAYISGGVERLSEYLSRAEELTGMELFLTDGAGRDLVTGRDLAGVVRQLETRRLAPVRVDDRVMLGWRSRDGEFWLLASPPWTPPRVPFFVPAHAWVLASVGLLSLVAARHLTAPLGKLERAVERFGQGDLAARVQSARTDEVGQLARAFDRMADRIEELVANERRLLVEISHELRSPLTRLNLAVELARTGEDREAALDRIEREAERLNALIGDLLQVTRGETDPRSVARMPVRLDELVGAVADDCRLDAQAQGCRIEERMVRPGVVNGNPELLRRAVENLVRNAIRYAPRDTAVELTVEGGRITVRDYGPGVPSEALPRLFDPFYRVENASGGGFGLGLSIARRAVQLHGGTIRARNAGPGLEVEIMLESVVEAGKRSFSS